MRTVAIIQARVGSSRFPAKVLADIGGQAMLARVLGRVSQARTIDQVVVATTIAPADDAVERLCRELGFACFRGSEEDVLARYHGAAEEFAADAIVRLTADCPLLSPEVIDLVVTGFRQLGADYASNVLPPTYPDGLDTEIFSRATLEATHREARLPSEREHVTPFIFSHPERFQRHNVEHRENLSGWRWTVDEQVDLDLVRAVYNHFGSQAFRLEDVVQFVRDNMRVLDANKDIRRNEGYEKSLMKDRRLQSDRVPLLRQRIGPLLVRVDASSRMGVGHFMRCLALAQGWRAKEGEVRFVMSEPALHLTDRLAGEGIACVPLTSASPGSLADAEETAGIYRRDHAELLVIDGYHFDAEYQARLARQQVRLLAFDDFGHATQYSADFVLNQTNCASERLYANRAPDTQLLLGTDYTLFRRDFWSYASFQREHPLRATKVLVTLGGSDPENVTAKVISGLCQLRSREFEVAVVVGGANLHRESVAAQFAESGLRGCLLSDVANMPERMAWADIAVTAGGSTVWELALLGVPCVSVALAENQVPCLAQLHAAGAMLNLGWHQSATPRAFAAAIESLAHDQLLRIEMSRRLRSYVDGCGLDRVLRAVCQANSERRAA